MVKLKDLLKESSPGYENRQFGDPLPTLEDVMKEKKMKDLELGKVYTDKDMPPFKVTEDANVKMDTSYDNVNEETIGEDFKISDKHTLKVTPDGGIILFGRKGKIMMNRDEIKNLLRGLKKNRIPEDVDEATSSKSFFSGFKQLPLYKEMNPNQRQAVNIALIMGGDMTGAVAAIEKIKKGLSKDKKVRNALKLANESVNEHTVTFTKDDMKKLHSSGEVIKADPDGKEHTYVYKEYVKV